MMCLRDAGVPALANSSSKVGGDEYSIRRRDFQAKMENAISGIIKASNNKSAIICLEWMEDKEFNAFALKLSDERDNYLIFLNTGIDETAENIVNSPEFVAACRKLKRLSFLDDKTLGSFAHYLVLCFILFHELGHVIRGHSNYRRAFGISNSNVFRANNPNINELPDVGVRIHITECDADNFAARLLVGCIQELAQMEAIRTEGLASGASEMIFDELASLGCVCMATVFNYFDRSPHGSANPYPLAPIRLTVSLGTFSDQLVEIGTKYRRALNIATRALEIAEDYLKSSGWKVQPLDLKKAAKCWSEDFLPEIRQYSSNSHKYTKFTASHQ